MGKSDSSKSPELMRLISELIDSQMTASDHEKLCELLQSDVEAQEVYHQIMSVHALLRFELLEASRITVPVRALNGNPDFSGSTSLWTQFRLFRQPLKAWMINALILAAGWLVILAVVSSNNEKSEQLVAVKQGGPFNGTTQETRIPPVCLVVFRTNSSSQSTTDQPQPFDEVKSGLSISRMADIATFIKEQGVRAKSFTGNRPEIVRQNEDGSVVLSAKTAQIFGKTLVFEEEFGNLGWWGSSDDWAMWEFSTNSAATFELVIEYACDDQNANNPFVLAIDDNQVHGIAVGTGDWDQYRHLVVGQIRVEPGSHRLVFRATDELKGYLLDLQSVKLRPITLGTEKETRS